MKNLIPREHFSWKLVKEYSFIILGALIQALAMRLFLIPGQLVSGGISGAAQIINYYTGWPIGLMVFVGISRFSSLAGGSWAEPVLRSGLLWRSRRFHS